MSGNVSITQHSTGLPIPSQACQAACFAARGTYQKGICLLYWLMMIYNGHAGLNIACCPGVSYFSPTLGWQLRVESGVYF